MTIKGLKALHLQLKVDAARCSGKLYYRMMPWCASWRVSLLSTECTVEAYMLQEAWE